MKFKNKSLPYCYSNCKKVEKKFGIILKFYGKDLNKFVLLL